MDMVMTTSSAMMSMAAMPTSTAAGAASTAVVMSMSMGDSGGCKLSMLLNWHTIDACFLSSTFHIRSTSTFFLSCLASFILVISLEFLRRAQRDFDRFLRIRNSKLQDEEYVLPDDLEEKLLPSDGQKVILRGKLKGRILAIMAEQLLRGLIYTVQFSVSYCIMLLFMYSNGYIIISILLGALVGFALFTRDTLYYRRNHINDLDEQEKVCC